MAKANRRVRVPLKGGTVSRWRNLGSIWSTVRELDVSAISAESEQAFTIACFGTPALLDALTSLLHTDAYQRSDTSAASSGQLVAASRDRLAFYQLPLKKPLDQLQQADMLLLAIDGRQPLAAESRSTFEQLSAPALPLLVVVLYTEHLPAPTAGDALLPWPSNQAVAVGNPTDAAAPELLASALLARLPGELHLAAARRFPALRQSVARELISSAAFSNSSYALASGLAEQFPVLNIGIAAADMLILTKNQIMLIYKLALIHGRPPDLQASIREVLSVIGSAYLWRQAARTLVGLIPVVGIAPKVAIAYTGTYSVGMVAWRWFASGELVSREQLEQIRREAMTTGRQFAASLQGKIQGGRQRTSERIRRVLTRSPGTTATRGR